MSTSNRDELKPLAAWINHRAAGHEDFNAAWKESNLADLTEHAGAFLPKLQAVAVDGVLHTCRRWLDEFVRAQDALARRWAKHPPVLPKRAAAAAGWGTVNVAAAAVPAPMPAPDEMGLCQPPATREPLFPPCRQAVFAPDVAKQVEKALAIVRKARDRWEAGEPYKLPRASPPRQALKPVEPVQYVPKWVAKNK